jgi:hypothetical protein
LETDEKITLYVEHDLMDDDDFVTGVLFRDSIAASAVPVATYVSSEGMVSAEEYGAAREKADFRPGVSRRADHEVHERLARIHGLIDEVTEDGRLEQGQSFVRVDLLLAAMRGVEPSSCPTCGSPSPDKHPSNRHPFIDGSVQLAACPDEYHLTQDDSDASEFILCPACKQMSLHVTTLRCDNCNHDAA